MNRLLYILIVLVSFTLNSAFAQGDDLDRQLAVQYYQQGEFEKAVVLFEKIYNKDNSIAYYNYLYDCYISLDDYKAAEKHVKKRIKFDPGSAANYVDLGFVYEQWNEPRKASKEYNEAIDLITANPDVIIRVADAFKSKKKFDLAIETYEKGEKLLNGSYPFAFEKSEIFMIQGDIPKIVEEYLDVLDINRGYFDQVQSALQTLLNDDVSGKRRELLKSKLLSRIQDNKNEIVYSELMIWLFLQEKNFEAAFIQSKALDKRNKEDGKRVFDLAIIAADNFEFSTAIECFQYVIEKGDDSFYYLSSRIKLIQVMRQKLLFEAKYNQDDLYKLEKEYLKTLDELGSSYRTVELKRDLANFQAFYLNKVDTAIHLLEETIKIPRTPQKELALCKLTLGDILVYKGDVWEAVLYYGQVETEYKHDLLGHDAKFRKAKVYYYTGDFAWAKSQLDVLKASTSKLIANDALSLSLIISDNTGLDTNEVPVKLYAKADMFYFQKQYQKAEAILDTIENEYKYHLEIQDDLFLLKAKIKMENRDYEKAVFYYDKLISLTTALADDGLLELGLLYESKLVEKEKAKECYKRLLLEYPGSIHSIMGRKRFRYLRGDIHLNSDIDPTHEYNFMRGIPNN